QVAEERHVAAGAERAEVVLHDGADLVRGEVRKRQPGDDHVELAVGAQFSDQCRVDGGAVGDRLEHRIALDQPGEVLDEHRIGFDQVHSVTGAHTRRNSPGDGTGTGACFQNAQRRRGIVPLGNVAGQLAGECGTAGNDGARGAESLHRLPKKESTVPNKPGPSEGSGVMVGCHGGNATASRGKTGVNHRCGGCSVSRSSAMTGSSAWRLSGRSGPRPNMPCTPPLIRTVVAGTPTAANARA